MFIKKAKLIFKFNLKIEFQMIYNVRVFLLIITILLNIWYVYKPKKEIKRFQGFPKKRIDWPIKKILNRPLKYSRFSISRDNFMVYL